MSTSIILDAVTPPRKPGKLAKKPAVTPLAEAVLSAQKDAIRAALEACDYSPTEAAEALGIQGGAGNMIRLMKRIGIYDEYKLERLERERRAIKSRPE